MTPTERSVAWRELEKKYMPWRDYDGDKFFEKGNWWYHKIHIFLYPFYYINYTLTTMGAMEFKKKMALALAKTTSITAGKKLGHDELMDLVCKLFSSSNPAFTARLIFCTAPQSEITTPLNFHSSLKTSFKRYLFSEHQIPLTLL